VHRKRAATQTCGFIAIGHPVGMGTEIGISRPAFWPCCDPKERPIIYCIYGMLGSQPKNFATF
jgi:hypothetical protein